MLYTVDDNAIDYSIYDRNDKMPTDLDLIFSVGGANKIIYISEIHTAEGGGISEIVSTLNAFVDAFKDNVIIFTIEESMSASNAVIMRYILQQVGFCSLKKFIDEKDATVFMFVNAYTSDVYTKIFDEFISFELEDMLTESVSQPEHSFDRLDLLLKRLGKEKAMKLCQYAEKFFSETANTENPTKINV